MFDFLVFFLYFFVIYLTFKFMSSFFNIFYPQGLFFSLYKSLCFFLAKNAFFLKLCLVFVSTLVILNEKEISQFFLLISLVSTLLVFTISFLILLKEFFHFFFKFLSSYKFALFIFIHHLFFLIVVYSIFSLILTEKLCILLFDIIAIRFSFFQITSFCYLLFIFVLFFSNSVRDKNKFSLSYFYQKFLEFLPPVFFALLLLSLALLTFQSNFFIVYILALFIFFPELKIFYQETWTPQIQNSSFVWHILRFSSGAPFLFLDSVFATDFFLNGKIFISLEKSLNGSSWRKGAIYAAQMPRRMFSEASPFIVQKFLEVQCRPIRSKEMITWLADSSKKLVNQGIILPQHGTTSITAGLELQHLYMLLNYEYFEGASLIPTVIPFMNEGFFILQQKLNAQSLVDLRALALKNPNFVGLVLTENHDSWMILRNTALEPLNAPTIKLLDAFISYNLKLEDWSTQYPETNKLSAYKVDVEDFFAIKSNIAERIQTKTEWDGLTGKTFVSKNSDVLVNKFSPPENESILLKNGKVIDNFKFSPKDPKFKVFCADLIENKGKLAASKSSADYLPLIENVIKSTLKNKFTK